jgi:hypothetical protein
MIGILVPLTLSTGKTNSKRRNDGRNDLRFTLYGESSRSSLSSMCSLSSFVNVTLGPFLLTA